MVVNAALSSALSGLSAARREADIVSSNIANALTEGYGTRSLVRTSRVLGPEGVGVDTPAVQRHSNPAALGERRVAGAERAAEELTVTFWSDLESVLGMPGSGQALTDRITSLESALALAASDPSSEVRLTSVADAAGRLAGALNQLTGHIQQARLSADAEIAQTVEALNRDMESVADLNAAIARSQALRQDTSALQDQRQRVIDRISDQIALTEVSRPDGQIALIAESGAILLDGSPKSMTFVPVNTVTPEMSVADGTLSGVLVDGRPISATDRLGGLTGGRLEALFSIRDDLAVTAQASVDSIAADLIERTSDPAVDTSLSPGDAGLFVDRNPPPASLQTGLAGRIAMNPLVNEGQGGSVSRLRDGLGAVRDTIPGDPTRLVALAQALSAERSLSGGGPADTLAGHASGVLSTVSQTRLSSEELLTGASAREAAAKDAELSAAVDTDAELQRLLEIEDAYAANARVIRTLDTMMRDLLEMV